MTDDSEFLAWRARRSWSSAGAESARRVFDWLRHPKVNLYGAHDPDRQIGAVRKAAHPPDTVLLPVLRDVLAVKSTHPHVWHSPTAYPGGRTLRTKIVRRAAEHHLVAAELAAELYMVVAGSAHRRVKMDLFLDDHTVDDALLRVSGFELDDAVRATVTRVRGRETDAWFQTMSYDNIPAASQAGTGESRQDLIERVLGEHGARPAVAETSKRHPEFTGSGPSHQATVYAVALAVSDLFTLAYGARGRDGVLAAVVRREWVANVLATYGRGGLSGRDAVAVLLDVDDDDQGVRWYARAVRDDPPVKNLEKVSLNPSISRHLDTVRRLGPPDRVRLPGSSVRSSGRLSASAPRPVTGPRRDARHGAVRGPRTGADSTPTAR